MIADETMVLSVPAGLSYALIVKYGVHACPDTYKYRPVKYITFRQPGGVMSAVHFITLVCIVNSSSFTLDHIVEYSERKRIATYWTEFKSLSPLVKDENFRFYLLSLFEQIDLPHLPKPRVNSAGHCYFDLSELVSGRKNVKVASKKNFLRTR